jgi:hypothetical protein
VVDGVVVAPPAAALACAGVTLLAARAVFEVDTLALAAPGQTQPGVVFLAPFQFRNQRVGRRGQGVQPRGSSTGAQVEAAAQGQRAVDPQRQPLAVTAASALGPAAFDAGAATPGVARLARDDVDDTAQRLGPVQHRHRAAHDFDAFDVFHRDPVVLEVRVADDAIAGAHAPAVDEEQRVFAVHAAQAEHLAPADGPALQADAGFAAQRVEQVVGAAGLDLAPRDHAQRGRRGRFEHAVAGGGDDDALQRRRWCRLEGPRGRRGRARPSRER